jgi:hypothetical protein
VNEGEEAPGSVHKRELTEDQATDHLKEAKVLADHIATMKVAKALSWRQVRDYLVKQFGLMMDPEPKARQAMAEACPGGRWTTNEERPRVFGRLDNVLMNAALVDEIARREGGEWKGLDPRTRNETRNELIRSSLEDPEAF